MNQKAQSSLEYLLTYGWALILIATLIAVLVFVISSPASDIIFASSNPTKIMVKAGGVSNSTAKIVLQNITGGKMTITAISLACGYSNCTLNGDRIPSSDPLPLTAGGEMHIECADVTNAGGTTSIYYTDHANLQRSVDISAKMPAGSGEAGFVACYRMDRGSGSAAFDGSDNRNHGALENGPVWQTTGCPSGSCLLFDGIEDFVAIDSVNDELSRANTSYTISSWINGTVSDAGLDGHGHIIVSFHNSPILVGAVLKLGADTGRAFVESPNDTFVWGSNLLSDDTWHHVALVADGSSYSIYVDGAYDTSGQTPLPIPSNGYGSIGQEWDGGGPVPSDFFDGMIDEVEIYNRALDAGQICDLCEKYAGAAGVICNCP